MLRDALITLVSFGLGIASMLLAPYLFLLACLGFTGHLADAGWDENLKGGVFFAALALTILFSTALWFVYLQPRLTKTP